MDIIFDSLIMISIISFNLNSCCKCTVWNNILAQNEVFTRWNAFDGDIVGKLSWVG